MSTNNEFNSLGEVLKYFIRMNNNVLQILSTLSHSITTDQETLSVTNVGPDDIERTFSVPSYSYFAKRINEMNNNIEKLYQIKDKELGNPIFNKYLIAEDNSISDISIPKTFYSKPNFILENLLNPLLFIRIDFTNKISSETTNLMVRRIILNLDNELKRNFYENNFKNINNLIYADVINKLSAEGINYIIDDDNRELSPTILKYSGAYDIITVYSETIKNLNYTIVRKVNVNKLTYFDNINMVEKQLNIGDIVLSEDGDTEYEIVNIDFIKNDLTLGRKSGNNELSIGINKLKIGTAPVGTKILEIPISYSDNQIIFTKAINPYYNTIASDWNLGFGISSNDLLITTDEGTITFENYYKSIVTDYGRILNELAKQTNITPETTNSILSQILQSETIDTNSITVYPPTLEDKSFKIVDLNEGLIDKDLTKRAQDILNAKTNKENEKATISSEIDALNTLIFDEMQKTNPDIEDINAWKATKAEKETAKILLVQDINNIIDDIKNMNISISSDPFPVIVGAVQLPTIPDITQPDELFVCYLEYRYRFLTTKKVATNSYSLELGNGTVTTSYWHHENGPKMHRTKTNNEYVYQQLDNLDPDVLSINEIQLPLFNIEPGFIEIQARFCYQLTPITPVQSTIWSESIFINYADFVKIHNSSPIHLLQQEIYTADITKKYDDVNAVIANLLERIQKLEDIKTTNSYQYKDVIVLTDYNVQAKTFELSKIPQTTNIIMQVVGGQPIAPDEYTVYYKQITWDELSVMNALTTGDTLIIEYLI